MPSKPPPLPSVSSPSLPWWDPPPASRSGEPSRINWSVILASVSVSFALVVCIIAWIVTHPNKAAGSLASPNVVVAVTPANLPPPPVPPLPRLSRGIETMPALHRPDRLETIVNPLLLAEETPPPLPPPAPHSAAPRPQRETVPAAVHAAPHAVGETYGTQVLFFNNQEAATDLARRDHKLLFVMHISGNFEDSCFTWNNAEAFRANALANAEVGKYLNGNFVATYQKVGTFTINGGQKQGGNVSSYFCTPEGRVLHAIAGPVKAEVLLREARWVVETAKLAALEGVKSESRRRVFWRKAHSDRLQQEHQVEVARIGRAHRRMNLNKAGLVHLLLATTPMPRLEQVYKLVFEKILKEKVSTAPVVRAGG